MQAEALIPLNRRDGKSDALAVALRGPRNKHSDVRPNRRGRTRRTAYLAEVKALRTSPNRAGGVVGIPLQGGTIFRLGLATGSEKGAVIVAAEGRAGEGVHLALATHCLATTPQQRAAVADLFWSAEVGVAIGNQKGTAAGLWVGIGTFVGLRLLRSLV